MEQYYLTTTPMSKDKPGKNVKKERNRLLITSQEKSHHPAMM
jgi:hypothetical protein